MPPRFSFPTLRTVLLAAACIGVAGAQEGDVNHVAEDIRSEIEHIVVVPGASPTDQDITGTYDEDGLGAAGGYAAGAQLGTPSINVGPVSVGTTIPELIFPGAIVGGAVGEMQRSVQEFRDALAEDLAGSTGRTLNSSKLARQVYQDLRHMPSPDARLFAVSTPIPEDIDTLLYVGIRDIAIDVDGGKAVLKTTAEVTLRRLSDGERLDRRWIYYRDKDSLSNWTDNDNQLWHEYANFALHYLGREIAATALSRVDIDHKLEPAKSDSVKLKRSNPWQASSKSLAPTLAWNFELEDETSQYPWDIDASNVSFDLEIYDRQRLVFIQRQIPQASFEFPSQLEPCKNYLWTVRPSFSVNGTQRHGQWMRKSYENVTENAVVGEKASAGHAYLQGFATLKIDCRAK